MAVKRIRCRCLVYVRRNRCVWNSGGRGERSAATVVFFNGRRRPGPVVSVGTRAVGWASFITAAPPHRRTIAPANHRTVKPPHRRTIAPSHRHTPPHFPLRAPSPGSQQYSMPPLYGLRVTIVFSAAAAAAAPSRTVKTIFVPRPYHVNTYSKIAVVIRRGKQLLTFMLSNIRAYSLKYSFVRIEYLNTVNRSITYLFFTKQFF